MAVPWGVCCLRINTGRNKTSFQIIYSPSDTTVWMTELILSPILDKVPSVERNFRGKKCNENLNAVNNQTGQKNQHMDKSQTFQASACVLLSHAAYQCLSWLRFPYYPRMDKGAKREIWHSFTFLVVQASPVLVFPSQQHVRDGISGGRKETE